MDQELGPHEVAEVHAAAIPDRRFRRGNGLHGGALLMRDSEEGQDHTGALAIILISRTR
jgi:hypothetical protein